MRLTLLLFSILCFSFQAFSQIDLQKPFKDCGIDGSITIYDLKNNKWTFSDEADSKVATLPASTFKIINLAIALETRVIRDENEMMKWPGSTDTVLYGYRPEIYKDMSVKQAFEESAGWAFIELAKKIGKERYRDYLKKCKYGNADVSQPDADFWNYGPFAISPKNQVDFLVALYKEKLPFSKRTLQIVKRVMLYDETPEFTQRGKTGWTRDKGVDTGWWVGYIERKDNVYFYATRLIKDRKIKNANFGSCRKTITHTILKEMGVM